MSSLSMPVLRSRCYQLRDDCVNRYPSLREDRWEENCWYDRWFQLHLKIRALQIGLLLEKRLEYHPERQVDLVGFAGEQFLDELW